MEIPYLYYFCMGEGLVEGKFSSAALSSVAFSGSQFAPFQADASPQPRGATPGSLNAIIQNFKSVSTREINQAFNTLGNKIWQRDYFERVIWNERELNAIRRYIQDNPLKWERDRENPNIVTL